MPHHRPPANAREVSPNKPEEASSIMGAVHRQPRRSAPWRSDVNLHPTPPRHPSHHPIHARNPSAGGVGQSGSKPMPAGVPGIRSPRKNVPMPSQCSRTIVRDSPSPQYRTPAAGLRLQATFCAATNQTARRPPANVSSVGLVEGTTLMGLTQQQAGFVAADRR